jgi:DNA-binding NarL/FixJ family response regulator
MIKAAIVDDHQLFRKGLVMLVNTFEGVEVVLEAANGIQLLSDLKNTPVDILLLDIQMPQMDGYKICISVREQFPDIKVLIVSQLNTREAVHKVMECGAHGFFSKNSNPEHLEQAIFNISDRDFYFSHELGAIIREAILWDKNKQADPTSSQPVITPREMEVIRLACKELSSIEIADKLCITVRTVDTHRKRIMERTNSKNFIGVILYAIKHNLLSVDDI